MTEYTPIYLDHMATTPIDPRVLDEMLPYMTLNFANAASKSHRAGQSARDAVERARQRVANLYGCEPLEVIFTSGATESNNLALKGLAESYPQKKHVLSSPIEHPSVLDTLDYLKTKGFQVELLKVDTLGNVNLDHLKSAIRPETLAVSIMAVNNEIGTLQDLEAIGQITRSQQAFFHCDVTQMFGKLPLDVNRAQIDLASCSAHKCHGPKGVGALFIRRKHPRVRLAPQLHGGGHERGYRSGTLNIPGVVGFGQACNIARSEMAKDEAHARLLAKMFLNVWGQTTLDFEILGHPIQRLPQNLNLHIPGVHIGKVLEAMPEVALSVGSACSAIKDRPSHVLRAIGKSFDEARSCLRIGFGRFNSLDEVESVAKRLAGLIQSAEEKGWTMQDSPHCEL